MESGRQAGLRLAEEARSSAVAPLRNELALIREAVEASQDAYASDIARVRQCGTQVQCSAL